MQGSQLSQCSIIRKFFLSGARIAKKRRVRFAALSGLRPGSYPIAALIRPLVNFDVEACAGDLILKAAPASGQEHEHNRCKGDLGKTSCLRAAGVIDPAKRLVYPLEASHPFCREKSQEIFSPSYLDIIACVACLSRSPSDPAIAHCSLRELPVCRVRCRISERCGVGMSVGVGVVGCEGRRVL
jgi:hypothetical protein